MAQLVSKAVGIDLGTTNSAVAMMNPDDTDIIVHSDPVSRSQTTPSCLWKNPATGETVVGRKALMRVGTVPEPIRSIKRLMGQQTTVPLTGEQDRISPEEVSAAILAEMKRQIAEDLAGMATAETSWMVDRAIVTVPAYFDQPSIEATHKAAEIAGLEVVDLLHEPTAAAAHYCWRTSTRDGTFLVYDLGGGTFDVSVVQCVAGAFEVLGISGNNRLGGDDIDAAIARRLQEVLLAEGWALDLNLGDDADDADRRRFGQLKRLAGEAKKALSTETEYLLRNDGMIKDKNGNPVVIEVMLERSDVEAASHELIERTLGYCDQAIDRAREQAGITLADVDQVLLAGGSTHMPLVRDMVRGALCSPAGAPGGAPSPDGPRAKCTEPVYEKVDTIVARGAAIRAAAVGGLTIYDPGRTLRVSFRGTSATDEATARVRGTLQALSPELDLAGGAVHLTVGGYHAAADVSESGGFVFAGVPLPHETGNRLTFEVVDGAGTSRARLVRPVTRNAEPIDEGSTAVNPKAVELEVRRDGRLGRAVLIPALEPLPTRKTRIFDHPGGVETLLLSFYQAGRKIKLIKVPVPSSTPRGTPVTIDVGMDDKYLMTVSGSIDDQTFEAVIEPPPERAMPEQREVDELESRFNEAVGYLPAGERNKARIRWTLAYRSLRDAMARGDRRQAVHDLEELEDIVGSLGDVKAPLEPAKHLFDRLVQQCLELNEYVSKTAATAPGRVPHDAGEMARAIDAQRGAGEVAFEAADQRSYGEAYTQLERYAEHLRETYARSRPARPEPTEAELAISALSRAGQLADRVQSLARAAGRNDLHDEAAAIERKIEDALTQVERDPVPAREQGRAYEARLVQLETILNTRLGPEGDVPTAHGTT